MEETKWAALFESYLEGSISDGDKTVLEHQLQNNREVQSDFETYKMMRESLAHQKIKNNLRAQNYFLPKWRQNWNKFWPYGLVFLIAILLLFLWAKGGTKYGENLLKDPDFSAPIESTTQDQEATTPEVPFSDNVERDDTEPTIQNTSKPRPAKSNQLNKIIAEFLEEGVVMRSESKVEVSKSLCFEYLVQKKFEACLKCIDQGNKADGLSIDQKEWLKALSYWGLNDYSQAKIILESISSESLHEYQARAKKLLEEWPPIN